MSYYINQFIMASRDILGILCCLCLIPKNSHFILRFILSNAAFLCLMVPFQLYEQNNSALFIWILILLLRFLMLSAVTRICYRIPILKAGFLALFVLCLVQFAFTLGNLFPVSQTALMVPTLLIYCGIFLIIWSLNRKLRLFDAALTISPWVFAAGILTAFPIALFNHVMYMNNNFDTSVSMLVYCALFAFASCLFVLFLLVILSKQNSLNCELTTIKQLWKQGQIQYQIASSNIALMDKQAHDMIHELTELYTLDDREERRKFLDRLSSPFRLYDQFLQTGNKALDTILTEKNLYCSSKEILFKCIANGKSMDFIEPADIYTMLGGIIDNAINHVAVIEDRNNRMITVNVRLINAILLITVENYLEKDRTISDYDYEDFSVRSAMRIAQKYEGNLNLACQNHIYKASIIIPVPQK